MLNSRSDPIACRQTTSTVAKMAVFIAIKRQWPIISKSEGNDSHF